MEKNNNYFTHLRPVTVAISVASPEPRNLNDPEIYQSSSATVFSPKLVDAGVYKIIKASSMHK